MTNLVVNVTAEDIGASGSRTSRLPLSCFCPVALAIRRALGTERVVVGPHDFIIGGFEVAPLPPEAQDFIRRFDADLPVEPITFTLPPLVAKE